MNALTPAKAAEIMEAVIAKGDIAALTADQRAKFYIRVCESIGLNPMTRPFEYITLNNKLTLYARKDATDQLRSMHNISVTELLESEREGVFIVTAKVSNGFRSDAAKGAVSILGLKGDALANAMMKAETKAKRRATLSICGLGFLDESEVEGIPASDRGPSTVSSRAADTRLLQAMDVPDPDADSSADQPSTLAALIKEVEDSPGGSALWDWNQRQDVKERVATLSPAEVKELDAAVKKRLNAA